MSRTCRLFALAASLLVTPIASAQVTVSVFPSLAPNVFGSPSFPGWESNAVQALQLGQSSLGSPSLPTYYQQIPNGSTIQPFLVSDFPSWMLKANPGAVFGPAFASELGNRLYFNLHVNGNGQLFSISQLSLSAASSDAGNILGFTVSAGTYQYNSGFVGLNWGPDQIKGNGDDFFVTGGANTQPVNELFGRGSGNAPTVLATDPGATDQEKIDLRVLALPTPFTFTGTYTLATDAGAATGSATVLIGAVPEPATIMMGVAGVSVGGMVVYTRVKRRRRRVKAKVTSAG